MDSTLKNEVGRPSYYARTIEAECYYQIIVAGGDTLNAIRELKSEAKNNNPWAMTRIAECYLNGITEELGTDIAKGKGLLEKLVEQGFAFAQYKLAEYYLKTEKSKKTAKKLFKAAGKSGVSDAFYVLGQLHQNGEVLKKNLEKARKYFEKASQLGHIGAKEKLMDNLLVTNEQHEHQESQEEQEKKMNQKHKKQKKQKKQKKKQMGDLAPREQFSRDIDFILTNLTDMEGLNHGN